MNQPTLTWGLAVATHKRPEELQQCVEAALRQTRPPVEIVVADSRDDPVLARRLQEIVADAKTAARLTYLASPVAQQTVQRNLAVSHTTADVLFMIDDDTLMHPRCAEVLMSIYEGDLGTPVAAVTAAEAGTWPITDAALGAATRAGGGSQQRGSGFIDLFRPRQYREGRALSTYEYLGIPLDSIRSITGAYITVRRSVAVAEPFDVGLVLNVCEDFDATARFLNHGAIVSVRLPLMRHLQAARPGGQARRGWLNRFAFCLDHAYVTRKLILNWPRAVLYGTLSHGFVLAIDVARVPIQRCFSPLIGSLRATPRVLRMLALPRKDLSAYLVAASRRAQDKATRSI